MRKSLGFCMVLVGLMLFLLVFALRDLRWVGPAHLAIQDADALAQGAPAARK